MLMMLLTAPGETRGQPAWAFLAALHKEILWNKTTLGTDEAGLGKAQKATGKINYLPFAEQVQRRAQGRTSSRLVLEEQPRRCWGRARLGKKRGQEEVLLKYLCSSRLTKFVL